MSNLDDFSAARVRTWPIVLLRVYAGAFFCYFGLRKIARNDFVDSMASFIGGNLERSFAPFRPFLENVVLEYPSIFAILVPWGELLIGVSLLIGLATRYAAIAGAVMVLCYWMMKGQSILNAQNHDAVWLVIFVVIAGLHAGRTMGLDRRLAHRFPFLG